MRHFPLGSPLAKAAQTLSGPFDGSAFATKLTTESGNTTTTTLPSYTLARPERAARIRSRSLTLETAKATDWSCAPEAGGVRVGAHAKTASGRSRLIL